MSRNVTVLLSVLILTVGLNYPVAYSIISGASPEKSQFNKKERKEINRRAKKQAKKRIENLLLIDTGEIADRAVTFDKLAAECPEGTKALLGKCFETAIRDATTLLDAAGSARPWARGLPTAGELIMAFSGTTTSDLDGDFIAGEHTDSVYVDFFDMNVRVADMPGPNLFSGDVSLNAHFRCVFDPFDLAGKQGQGGKID